MAPGGELSDSLVAVGAGDEDGAGDGAGVEPVVGSAVGFSLSEVAAVGDVTFVLVTTMVGGSHGPLQFPLPTLERPKQKNAGNSQMRSKIMQGETKRREEKRHVKMEAMLKSIMILTTPAAMQRRPLKKLFQNGCLARDLKTRNALEVAQQAKQRVLARKATPRGEEAAKKIDIMARKEKDMKRGARMMSK